LDAAWGLSQADAAQAALERILDGIGRLTRADATAVLTLDGAGALAISAQRGLTAGAARRRFRPDRYERLRHALQSEHPVRFGDAADSDPYDGLLAASAGAIPRIHACIVAPLRVAGAPAGVLTLDALDPRGLDGIRDGEIALAAALASAVLHRRAQRNPALPRPLPGTAPVGGGPELLGASPAMAALRREIDVLATLPTTVLIEGPTGAGKELVARALHARSLRADAPLVVVNCAALPEPLIESEMFGHVRGAFTGAAEARLGKFAAAHGGTLLLDEIGELPLAVQPVLLRALQEGEIQRIGDDRKQRVDVRILAATNRDLRREVAAGRFRADLYHRLAVYPVRVPALGERSEDLATLVRHFADRVAGRLGRRWAPPGADALARLAAYAWPGNVRELEHAVERALLRALCQQPASGGGADAPLEPVWDAALALAAPPLAQPPDAGARWSTAEPLHATLDRVRREAIAQALADTDGNVPAAARRLGLSRSFAYKEAVRLGLMTPRRARR
jgi:anaerobic nitric oxide reductase transcription regulator